MTERARMDPKKRTMFQLVGVVLVMGSLAWAAVPLYSWFCRVTGWGGVTDVAAAAPEAALERTIKIRFDASKAAGMPWQFRAVAQEMEIRIGEEGLAYYEAYNPTDRVIAGTASYNVSPYSTGAYFSKIDCFCFEMQVLRPGEKVTMPVSFFVEPELLQDADAKHVPVITLSYTFHETDLPEDYYSDQAAANTNMNIHARGNL